MNVTDVKTSVWGVILFILTAALSFLAGQHTPQKIQAEPIDLLKTKYNINCPLKLYIEDDKLVVKSFSCTLNDMSKGRI